MFFRNNKTGLIVQATALACSSKILCKTVEGREFLKETKAFAREFTKTDLTTFPPQPKPAKLKEQK